MEEVIDLTEVVEDDRKYFDISGIDYQSIRGIRKRNEKKLKNNKG